ncbi:MAG: hypothetical protein SOU32_03785 [Lachnospiraceae bacterium]|nr:hypothetical protein [Lachnospiraceae bacterium]
MRNRYLIILSTFVLAACLCFGTPLCAVRIFASDAGTADLSSASEEAAGTEQSESDTADEEWNAVFGSSGEKILPDTSAKSVMEEQKQYLRQAVLGLRDLGLTPDAVFSNIRTLIAEQRVKSSKSGSSADSSSGASAELSDEAFLGSEASETGSGEGTSLQNESSAEEAESGAVGTQEGVMSYIPSGDSSVSDMEETLSGMGQAGEEAGRMLSEASKEAGQQIKKSFGEKLKESFSSFIDNLFK